MSNFFTNQGSSAVTHDTTLTGNGTPASPLGVTPGLFLQTVTHDTTLQGTGAALNPLGVVDYISKTEAIAFSIALG